MKRDTRPAQSAGRVRHISATPEIASALRLPASLADESFTLRLVVFGKRREPIVVECSFQFCGNWLVREYELTQLFLQAHHRKRLPFMLGRGGGQVGEPVRFRWMELGHVIFLSASRSIGSSLAGLCAECQRGRQHDPAFRC